MERYGQCIICGDDYRFILEWYGVNQHGKNPELVDESHVCGEFRHIFEASHHDDYGGIPDRIIDLEHTEHPRILEFVEGAMAAKKISQGLLGILLNIGEDMRVRSEKEVVPLRKQMKLPFFDYCI